VGRGKIYLILKNKRLMAAMDKLAQKFGRDIMQFGMERDCDNWEIAAEINKSALYDSNR
jgi:hypothetical protein